MNNNEKLGLIERVDRASEHQAKRALKSMILNCTVKNGTIARAIKDAIERHTPTPTIVYQQPEPEDEDEEALTPSRQKSNKKKKKKKEEDQDQDGSRQDEEVVSSTTTKHRSTRRRGDINGDPLVGGLILKKTKDNLMRKKKRSRHHDEEEKGPHESKKNRSKHTSKHRDGTEQGRSSKQKHPTVIDLVASSDNETRDIVQSGHEGLDVKSSAVDRFDFDIDSSDHHIPAGDSSDGNAIEDGGSKDDGAEDESFEWDSSDDEDIEHKQQSNAITGGFEPSQDGSKKEATQANVEGGYGDRGPAPSGMIFEAKGSNQKEDIETSLSSFGKKRKAPERTAEEINNDQAPMPTTDANLNKRPKQDHPEKPQSSLEDHTCGKCGLLLPSVAQLMKHQVHCKDVSTILGNRPRSEPAKDEKPIQVEQKQVATKLAGDGRTDEPHNVLQLPARPRQRAPEDRGLSVLPPTSVHEQKKLPRGPGQTPMALARPVSGIQPSAPGQAHRPVPKSPSSGPRFQPFQLPRPVTHKQDSEDWALVLHRCKYCKKWFRYCDNSSGACCCHPGRYRPLPTKHLEPGFSIGSTVPPLPVAAWTCCRRQNEDAPPCRTKAHARE